MTWILCAIFFASGASALVFETLWFHQAGLGLGNSVWASSLVLAGFMGGLALGNALAARYGERLGHPVRVYALFEAVIAVTGVTLVYGLPHLGPALAPILGPWLDRPWIVNPARLAVAFALLLVPSTAMGLTLPLLTKALATSKQSFGPVLGRLYGWNTLGAVTGVVASEGLLIGSLGVRGSALAAGGLNALAAAVAARVARRLPVESLREPVPPRAPAPETGRRWLQAAFLSGFALLALEILWFRFLALFVMGHSLCLALMLALVLAGIALGGLAASAALRRWPEAHEHASAVAAAAGALCIASYAAFPWLAPAPPPDAALVTEPLDVLRIGAPLMLPVSLLSGAFFTLVGASLRGELSSETETAGSLTFANTTGAALGSLAGGFLFLPALGVERSLLAIALLYAPVAWLALAPRRGPRLTALAAAAGLALAAALFPFGALEARHLRVAVERWTHGGSAEVILLREGPTETVIYLDRRELGIHHSYRMLTNGYSMAGNDNRSRRYMKLYAYWPLAVHPDARKALLISYGAGSTARALTDSKQLESIDVVDISKTILESNHVVYPEPHEHPLRDPRVRVHIEDGRYFLRTSRERFDLITGEPPPPREAGVVNLYTREYFELLRKRLAEGGIVTYWLPLHALSEVSARSILRAFCDAFDDCSLWHGNGRDLMMVGTRNARGPVSEEVFTRQWRDARVGSEMAELGFERPEQLGALFIGDAGYLKALTRDDLPLVDDFPKRVMAASAHPGRTPPDYLAWQNAAGARARFEASPLIEQLWPASLRRASLPYFEAQGLINLAGFAAHTSLDDAIAGLHHVITETDLRAPVLWSLNSDADVQRVMGELDASQRRRPGVQFHLGIGRLAERDFAGAVEALRRAESHIEWGRDAFRLRAYALCLDGRADEARRLASERYAALGSGLRLPPFWSWMSETFGVDPTRPTQLAVSR